jgi:quercetin dioxygenase-like cupin family protein
MPNIDRRTLLYVFGAASITPMLRAGTIAAQTAGAKKVVAAKPGENRFTYASAKQAERSPCKLTSEDSQGALSIFELNVPSRTGPVRHVHHREDEWCYVLAGDFVFEVGGERYTMQPGGSIWMPRDIPHVWANQAATNGKLIVTCQPGGFEKFFNELGQIPPQANETRIKQVMAKYGMEYMGPPLFGLWRQEHQ